MTRRYILALIALVVSTSAVWAQEYNQLNDDGTFTGANDAFGGRRDSTKHKDKVIPKGLTIPPETSALRE